MTAAPHYDVLAVRYANALRTPGDAFLSRDPHDAPGEMDYFVWVIRNADRTIVVDTGFGPEAAARRKRALLRPVDQALASVGVDCATVADVVITHLHYDHAGNLALFPAATLHLQDDEMSYATGRFMCHPVVAQPFDVEDVCCMVRRVYAGRVRFHDGDAEIAPGISLHHIGGHSCGLMAVRVSTARGNVVLASDATHYYANMQRRDPFPILFDIGAVLEGYERLRSLADSEDHIIPGHDPLVRHRYPPVPGADAVMLHAPPRA
jgi:glyoxylase-like metal-dependent hydrolase (beta-lactamase superfamily II)